MQTKERATRGRVSAKKVNRSDDDSSSTMIVENTSVDNAKTGVSSDMDPPPTADAQSQPQSLHASSNAIVTETPPVSATVSMLASPLSSPAPPRTFVGDDNEGGPSRTASRSQRSPLSSLLSSPAIVATNVPSSSNSPTTGSPSSLRVGRSHAVSALSATMAEDDDSFIDALTRSVPIPRRRRVRPFVKAAAASAEAIVSPDPSSAHTLPFITTTSSTFSASASASASDVTSTGVPFADSAAAATTTTTTTATATATNTASTTASADPSQSPSYESKDTSTRKATMTVVDDDQSPGSKHDKCEKASAPAEAKAAVTVKSSAAAGIVVDDDDGDDGAGTPKGSEEKLNNKRREEDGSQSIGKRPNGSLLDLSQEAAALEAAREALAKGDIGAVAAATGGLDADWIEALKLVEEEANGRLRHSRARRNPPAETSLSTGSTPANKDANSVRATKKDTGRRRNSAKSRTVATRKSAPSSRRTRRRSAMVDGSNDNNDSSDDKVDENSEGAEQGNQHDISSKDAKCDSEPYSRAVRRGSGRKDESSGDEKKGDDSNKSVHGDSDETNEATPPDTEAAHSTPLAIALLSRSRARKRRKPTTGQRRTRQRRSPPARSSTIESTTAVTHLADDGAERSGRSSSPAVVTSTPSSSATSPPPIAVPSPSTSPPTAAPTQIASLSSKRSTRRSHRGKDSAAKAADLAASVAVPIQPPPTASSASGGITSNAAFMARLARASSPILVVGGVAGVERERLIRSVVC